MQRTLRAKNRADRSFVVSSFSIERKRFLTSFSMAKSDVRIFVIMITREFVVSDNVDDLSLSSQEAR